MINVFLLSFREYFEAFLLIAGFSILCNHYGLKRTKEIFTASITAFAISLSLTILIFITGSQFHDKQADLIEGWFLLSSSLVIALFAFPLHNRVWKSIVDKLPALEMRIRNQEGGFDWLLFMFVFLLIFKEGMEALLFTSGVAMSYMSGFMQNILGLVLGFLTAGSIGYILRTSGLNKWIDKFFMVTAFFVLLGMASLFREGLQLVTNMPYGLSDILAAIYGVVIYGFFVKKGISTKS